MNAEGSQAWEFVLIIRMFGADRTHLQATMTALRTSVETMEESGDLWHCPEVQMLQTMFLSVSR
jgi:hypothetical protein